MANLTDGIARDHLGPVLRPLGFKRTGRTFRKAAADGDSIVLDMPLSTGSSAAQQIFYVNLALVTLPWLAWVRRSDDVVTPPRTSEGCPSIQIRPEAQGVLQRSHWECTPASATGAAAPCS